MRILVINQHFHPEVASSAQIITELCEDLARKGHKVTVITGRPSYRRREEIPDVKDGAGMQGISRGAPPHGLLFRGLLKILPPSLLEWSEAFGIDIIRVYNYAPRLREDRWRYAQRMAQYLTFFISSFFVALALHKHNVVLYLSTPPLLNGITANVLRIVKGSPNVMNTQDLYPDVAVRLGVLKNGAIISLCHRLEHYLYRSASRVVPIGVRMAECIEAKGILPSKVEIIPNWMDTNLIHPMSKVTPFSREHRILDKFVVMYSGNIGLSQGLENVVKAAALTQDLKDALYLFIGGGANLDSLKKLVDEHELNNVKFFPYQPKERLSESLSAADVHLLPLKKGLSMFAVPSKVYGIMASARPFIASVDEDSEISTIVKEARCGIRVAPEDPLALAEAVRSLYYDRSKLDSLGRNGRVYLEHRVTRSICVERYHSLLSRVCA